MKSFQWTLMLGVAAGLVSCGVDMPKEIPSSFETMTVKKSDIELPYKFSARMKGQNDVTVTPQVSGQLVKICVTEGQQVKQGQTLFTFQGQVPSLQGIVAVIAVLIFISISHTPDTYLRQGVDFIVFQHFITPHPGLRTHA